MPLQQSTTFGLMRHARTLWNEEKRYQGQKDSPLSDAGCSMAVQWGKSLAEKGWQRIVSSDLGRCRQTTEYINRVLQLPVDFTADLREQNWGDWSGLTYRELEKYHGPLLEKEIASGWHFTPPGGESRLQVLARAKRALRELHGRWPGERILVVCHSGVTKALLYDLSKRRYLPEEEPLLLPGYHVHLVVQQNDFLQLVRCNAFSLPQE